jgi:hypothetical protein
MLSADISGHPPTTGHRQAVLGGDQLTAEGCPRETPERLLLQVIERLGSLGCKVTVMSMFQPWVSSIQTLDSGCSSITLLLSFWCAGVGVLPSRRCPRLQSGTGHNLRLCAGPLPCGVQRAQCPPCH